MSKALSAFTAGLLDAVDGVAFSVKTNYGPEFEVYRPGDDTDAGSSPGGRSLIDALVGLKAAVIVRDSEGRMLTAYGDPPRTEPVRVLAALIVAGVVLFVFARGLMR